MGGEPQIPKGVPTAEEEALQAPGVDPIFTLALGPTFGLRSMLGSLAMGVLGSAMGISPLMNKVGAIPGPPLMAAVKSVPLLKEMAMAMGENVADFAAQHGVEATLRDEPDLLSAIGYRGLEPQTADMNLRMLRDLAGLTPVKSPYPAAFVGRPLGIAALIADARNQLGRARRR